MAGRDRTAHFGSKGSPYGDGQARRNGGATSDTYSLSGMSRALERPRPPMRTFTFGVGMNALANDCRCNGVRQAFAVGAHAGARLGATENAHRSLEGIDELVAAGVQVPDWAVLKLQRNAAEIADIRTVLAARLRLGRGGKLTLDEAEAFQRAAIRLGLLRHGRGRGRARGRKRKGIGSLLIGACCGALDSVFSVGKRKR